MSVAQKRLCLSSLIIKSWRHSLVAYLPDLITLGPRGALFLPVGTFWPTCLLRSNIKGDHDFPDIIIIYNNNNNLFIFIAQIQLKVFKCAFHSISKKKTISEHKIIKKRSYSQWYFTHIKWCLRYRSTQYPSRFSGIRGPGAVYPYWRVRLLIIYLYLFTCKWAIVFWSFSRSLLRFCYRNVWRYTSTSDLRFYAAGSSTSVREWYSGSRFLLVESSIKCPDKVKD